jgi:hypothetical protein
VALVVVAITESAAYLAGRYIFPSSIIFRPSLSDGENIRLQKLYQDYLQLRDPVLGWPFKDDAGIERDDSGSRINALYPYAGRPKSCVSLYGDSFTWSAEVSAEDAWAVVLSGLLNCRVANFGVGGYGTDQAYIRYLNNTADDAPVVFLNHLSENIMRNVTQFRPLIVGYDRSEKLNFKPRFVLNAANELEQIEIPTFDPAEYVRAITDPKKYLQHEFFLPEGDSGLVRLSFPYTFSIFRALQHFHIRAWLKDTPWYMGFYQTDHPSNGLNITAAIIEAFEKTARERGQIPIVTIIPTGLDLMHFRKHGEWSYQTLLDTLSRSGIDVLNFGDELVLKTADEDPCSLFHNCSSHFNERGYSYLATIAYEELAKRDLPNLLPATDNAP